MQCPGPFALNANQPTSNVFIADFIELNNFQFCRTVIDLNNKILEGLKKCEGAASDKNDETSDLKGEFAELDKACNESSDANICSWWFLYFLFGVLSSVRFAPDSKKLLVTFFFIIDFRICSEICSTAILCLFV